MAHALRGAYGDIFLIKENPTAADKSAIEGKFKSFHNASDNVATLMAKTFLGLLPLADLSNKGVSPHDFFQGTRESFAPNGCRSRSADS
jgi:hypothetical protein